MFSPNPIQALSFMILRSKQAYILNIYESVQQVSLKRDVSYRAVTLN